MKEIEEIASIIHNRPLGSAVCESVAWGLGCSFIHIEGKSVWGVFERSLDAAIRDIEGHPRGKLFRRLIEYGPHNPDETEALTSDGEGILSDPECGKCVEFIFSHMVNRFKGELAELLAIEPCQKLVGQLENEGVLPEGVHIYFGDMVHERRRVKVRRGEGGTRWVMEWGVKVRLFGQ